MNSADTLKNEIEHLLNNLKSEAINAVDFDRVGEMLEGLQSLLCDYDRVVAELELLKRDYRRRITGMLKAVMAGRTRDGDAELAAVLADDNHAFDGAELLELHKMVSARFRDCFPASFKYATGWAGVSYRRKNWMDHKL